MPNGCPSATAAGAQSCVVLGRTMYPVPLTALEGFAEVLPASWAGMRNLTPNKRVHVWSKSWLG